MKNKIITECRAGCGACCIAPSINTPLPGMPHGKPAGVRCINLDQQNMCVLFGRQDRPSFCSGLKPSADMCGENDCEAMNLIARLEEQTKN